MNYNETNNSSSGRFSFRDVMFQFLFVALFIFILLWLFPNKNYMEEFKKNLLENTTTASDQDSKLVTSAVFNQNITTMKEAAILYFTTPRLPENKGDVVKLTLKDMLDEHLLVAPLDEQGNVCDTEKSYVEITKVDDEYTLKVNLKCGSEEEYIIVHLGCYDYCNGAVCESKTKPIQTSNNNKPKNPSTDDPKPQPEISYEYEYKLKGHWTDWSSWSEWLTEKHTESVSKEVEIKTETTDGKTETKDATEQITYTCPDGYTLTGTKCTKGSEEVVTPTITKKYTCPSGYTLSDRKCKKGYVSTIDATRKVTYSCPSGYIISGNKCYKSSTTVMDANKVIKYSCPEEYVISGTSCTRTVKTIVRNTFTSPQSGSDYHLVKVDTRPACTGCAVITYYTYDITTVSKQTTAASSTITYTCNAGFTLAGTKCAKTSETTTAITKTESDYSCPSGYTLNGSKCKKTVITILDPDTSIHYSCKDGYNLVNSVCVKGYVTIIDATKHVRYTCSEGFTLEGKTCVKRTSGVTTTYYRYRTRTYIPGDIQWRNTKTDQTLLSKGYYLTGNKRVKASK